MILSFATIVPKEAWHGLHAHEETIHQPKDNNPNAPHFEEEHSHCPTLQFEFFAFFIPVIERIEIVSVAVYNTVSESEYKVMRYCLVSPQANSPPKFI